jgi:hypothetical protein
MTELGEYRGRFGLGIERVYVHFSQRMSERNALSWQSADAQLTDRRLMSASFFFRCADLQTGVGKGVNDAFRHLLCFLRINTLFGVPCGHHRSPWQLLHLLGADRP